MRPTAFGSNRLDAVIAVVGKTTEEGKIVARLRSDVRRGPNSPPGISPIPSGILWFRMRSETDSEVPSRRQQLEVRRRILTESGYKSFRPALSIKGR